MTGIVRQPQGAPQSPPPVIPVYGGTPNPQTDLTSVTTSSSASPVDATRSVNASNFSFPVFVGYTYPPVQGPPTFPGETPYGQSIPNPQTLTSDEMMARLEAMAPGSDQIKSLQNALFEASYLGRTQISGHTDDATRSAWANMLQDAHQYNTLHPDSPMTPDQWLAASAMATKQIGGGGAGGVGTSTSTSTSTSVSLTDPITAGVLLNQTLTQALGRGATQAERARFRAALNAYQEANPATTSTTVDRATGMVTRSSVHDRSVSPSAYAEAYAQSGNLGLEANTYKVATDYYAAAAKVLRAGGGF